MTQIRTSFRYLSVHVLSIGSSTKFHSALNTQVDGPTVVIESRAVGLCKLDSVAL